MARLLLLLFPALATLMVGRVQAESADEHVVKPVSSMSIQDSTPLVSGCDVAACDVSPPCCDLVCPVWEASIDFLHWRPRQRGLDYAVSEDGSALTVGSGQVHELQMDRDTGIRGQLAYRTKTGWGVSFGYTHFDTSGVDFVNRPPGVGELFATRSHPDTNEEADIAIASGSLDYQVFDILGYRSIFTNCFSNIQLFGGVRFADIDQSMRVDYDGRDFVDGVVASRMRMDGFGLRFGAEGVWRMASGLGVFGRVGGGLVLGRFQANLYESNIGGAALITDIQDDYHQAVPQIDLAGGVSWTWRAVSVAAGYEMTDWFNLSNRSVFIDDIHEGLYGPFDTDVLLEGLFVRAGVNY